MPRSSVPVDRKAAWNRTLHAQRFGYHPHPAPAAGQIWRYALGTCIRLTRVSKTHVYYRPFEQATENRLTIDYLLRNYLFVTADPWVEAWLVHEGSLRPAYG